MAPITSENKKIKPILDTFLNTWPECLDEKECNSIGNNCLAKLLYLDSEIETLKSAKSIFDWMYAFNTINNATYMYMIDIAMKNDDKELTFSIFTEAYSKGYIFTRSTNEMLLRCFLGDTVDRFTYILDYITEHTKTTTKIHRYKIINYVINGKDVTYHHFYQCKSHTHVLTHTNISHYVYIYIYIYIYRKNYQSNVLFRTCV